MQGNTNKKLINIDEAIIVAEKCIRELTNKTESKISDVRLEEFGLNNEGNWKIVLSYLVDNLNRGTALGTLYGTNKERLYKRFIVDNATKTVIKMEDKNLKD